MSRLARSVVPLVLLLAPVPLASQFFTPVPQPLPADSVQAYRYRRELFDPRHTLLRDSLERETDGTTVYERLQGFCRSIRAPEDQCAAELRRVVADTTTVAQTVKRRFVTKPLSVREELVTAFDTLAGIGDIDFLRRFTAASSPKDLYITTDVVSGLIGRFTFAIGNAISRSTRDTSDVESSGAKQLGTQGVEDATNTVLQMISNGGTVSARIGMPLYIGGGTTAQHGIAVYGLAGLIGPYSNTDSLRFAGSAVLEWAMGLTVRDRELNGGKPFGDLLVAARFGVGYGEGGIIQRQGCKHQKCRTMWFSQLAVGMRQGRSPGLVMLVTWVPEKFKDFRPKAVINLSALRF